MKSRVLALALALGCFALLFLRPPELSGARAGARVFRPRSPGRPGALVPRPSPAAAPGAVDSVGTRGGSTEATAVLSDSLPGVETECTDFRSGFPLVVRAQHLQSDGQVAPGWSPDPARLCLGTAQGVATTMISDGAGGAFVLWVDNRMGDGDIFAQHFVTRDSIAPGWPSDGIPVCMARGSQYRVAAVTDGRGDLIAAWQDYRAGGSGDIYAQRISVDGELAWQEDGVPVCADPAEQTAPALAPDGSGGVLLVWQDRRSGVPQLYVERLTDAGMPAEGDTAGGRPLVACPSAQTNPALVADGENGAIVVWQERNSTSSSLRALRVTAAGTVAAGWPPEGVVLSSASETPRWPATASDGAHGALIAWCQESGGSRILLTQRVAAVGTLPWGPNGVALTSGGGQVSFPAIVADSSSGAIVAWEDCRDGVQTDLYAQRVSGSGAVLWAAGGVPLCLAGGDQRSVSLASDGAGGALATWVDDVSSARAQFLRSRPVLTGPLPKLESVESGPGRARLTWRTAKGDRRSFVLERRVGEEEEWQTAATVHAGADGLMVAEDRGVSPGAVAHYRLVLPMGEAQVYLAEITVEIPLPKPLALRFARSEDRGRTVRVALTLATNEAAKLELFDVLGRKLCSRDVGSLGAGDHDVRLELPRYVRSGIYFLRLAQGPVTRTGRVTVLQ
jgi:hypothetical protein